MSQNMERTSIWQRMYRSITRVFLLIFIFCFSFFILLTQPIHALDDFSGDFFQPIYQPQWKQIQGILDIQKLSQNLEPVHLPIILYHYVENVKDRGDWIRIGLNTAPSIFEEQLKELIQSGYDTGFIKDIAPILVGIRSIPSKTVYLTFDDGYEDFYTDALPILKKYGMKSTIYIVDGFIGKKGYMNESQLKEVAGTSLVEIGSHSLSHVKLPSLDESRQKKEIEESKINLENRLGTKIKTFAYPFGTFDESTIVVTKNAGYSAAVSVIVGNEQSIDSLFSLSRIRVGTLIGADFIGKIEDTVQR